MAVLTRDQLDAIRLQLEAGINTGAKQRAVWNAAVQAVEDWFETSARTEISQAINAAISPATMTVAEKTAVAKFWLYSKFLRGG